MSRTFAVDPREITVREKPSLPASLVSPCKGQRLEEDTARYVYTGVDNVVGIG